MTSADLQIMIIIFAIIAAITAVKITRILCTRRR